MEEQQRTELSKRFPTEYMKKRIISFDIPDTYNYKQEKLVQVLDSKITKLV